MKVFLLVLVLFLLAFAGLAAGLLLHRRSLRGGCGSTKKEGCQEGSCSCSSASSSADRTPSPHP